MSTKKSTPSDDKSQEAAQPDQKKAVSVWAVECGQTVKVANPALRGQVIYRGAHGAAAAVHGWAQHEYNTGAPFECTRSDYEAALKAAATINKAGTYEPHKAAQAGA